MFSASFWIAKSSPKHTRVSTEVSCANRFCGLSQVRKTSLVVKENASACVMGNASEADRGLSLLSFLACHERPLLAGNDLQNCQHIFVINNHKPTNFWSGFPSTEDWRHLKAGSKSSKLGEPFWVQTPRSLNLVAAQLRFADCKIGFFQSSRSVPLAKRIEALGTRVIDHGIDGQQNFYEEVISADSLLVIPCIIQASFH